MLYLKRTCVPKCIRRNALWGLITGGSDKMEAYKKEFIDFMVDSQVLKFGDFVTKSGHTCLFGTGRGKSVRILDDTGMEQLISTICFR